MFNNDDILTLAKAGFNAQQIAALSKIELNSVYGRQNVNNTVTTQQLQQPVNNVATPQPLQQPGFIYHQSAPENDQHLINTNDFNQQIMNQLTSLTTAVQANGLANAGIMQEDRTVDDILEEIINPPEYTQNNNGGNNNGK